jgi:hypothetical protein
VLWVGVGCAAVQEACGAFSVWCFGWVWGVLQFKKLVVLSACGALGGCGWLLSQPGVLPGQGVLQLQPGSEAEQAVAVADAVPACTDSAEHVQLLNVGRCLFPLS